MFVSTWKDQEVKHLCEIFGLRLSYKLCIVSNVTLQECDSWSCEPELED